MFRLSNTANAAESSLTRQLFNRALKIGDDVVNLTLGDPDVKPNEEIRKAACDAIMAGKTRYSQNAGLLDTRKAYAGFFKKQYGIDINPETEVIATVGGMGALYLTLTATVNPDDEVIILGPYYVNYKQMINMNSGKPIVIDRLRRPDDDVLKDIKKSITDKTVAIVINTPCNPAGDILSPYFLDGLSKIAVENDLLVVTDEVYNSLVFDEKEASSIVTRPGMKERTIVIDSCSKRFCMTGYRIGFAVGPEEYISAMTRMQENIYSCAPLPSQYAAIKAYSGDFDNSNVKQTYEHRRNILVSYLEKIEKLSFIYPEATFYCMVDISKTGLKSEEFCYKLLDEAHVAVVPAKAYGDMYDDYIRIAFTLNDDKLKLACERLTKFMEQF